MIEMNRRMLVRNTSVLGLSMIVPGLPVWARAEETPSAIAPENFLGASSALSGIDPDDLKPAVPQDGVQLADAYVSLLKQAAPLPYHQLLSAYDALFFDGKSPAEIGAALLTDETGKPRKDAVGIGARLTMLMWLFGIWYGKTELSLIPEASGFVDDHLPDMVISARAYKSGWIWRFARAHPMGFSNFNFGSWADEPPKLNSFMKISET